MRMFREGGFKSVLTLFILMGALVGGWIEVATAAGFIGPNSTVSVEITVDKPTLPVNGTVFNNGANIGGAYTNTVTVITKKNGKLYAAPSVAITISSGLPSGALYYLDGKAEHEKCPSGATCPPTQPIPIAYRSLTFENTTGVVTAHFHSGGTPGTVVLTATVQDPVTQAVASASVTIQVIGGNGTVNNGFPGSIKFVMDSSPVYIQNNAIGTTGGVTQNTSKVFQIYVDDDFGQPIKSGDGHTLRVELLSNRPNGGERLSTTDAKGNFQEGPVVFADLVGGIATVVFHSGSLPGTVVLAATVDRRDNNVDNGLQLPITTYATVAIGTGQIASLNFTGPLADAVFVRKNNLVAITGSLCGSQTCDTVWNGVYNRVVSVVAADPFGNPPPAGTLVTFRLIDGPLDMLQNRYPDQGHGQFAISGYTGDPKEGDIEFLAPNRVNKRTPADTLNPFVVPNGVSYAIADPLCLLMLQDPESVLAKESRFEYHVGSRVIIGRAGNKLFVNAPFNQVSQNVGANVWYTVGCPPYKGNIANFGTGEVTVTTDANGVASTTMNYPSSQVGRRFMVSAEAAGGKVGAVLSHWYLGTPDGSILALIKPAGLVSQVQPAISDTWPSVVKVTHNMDAGGSLELPVTLQLLDGGVQSGGKLVRTPIPGVPISVDIVINDPAEASAIAAEEAMAKAQAAFDAFVAANPGVCDLIVQSAETAAVVERDATKCASQKTLLATLDAAKTTATQARTVANLHTPTASVIPTPLASGANGYVQAVLQVNDLPTDGSVDFYFSTVGPEVRSETLQITVQPTKAAATP